MNHCWLYQSTTRQHGPMVVFSKSKSICADSPGGSPLTLRYRDAAERREKGRLCFIEGKGTPFISNNRNFKQEKVDISRNQITTPKKQVDFLAKTLLFCILLPNLFEKVVRQTSPHLARFLRAPERTRTCTSRTQRVCFFCLHPSPSHLTHCHVVDCA